MPDAADEGGSGRGFYLQDAGYPQHLAWVLHAISAPKQLWRWRQAGMYLVKNWLKGSPDTDVTGKIADLMLPSELSAGGLPLLGMGRDVPDGRMFLRDGRLDLDWKAPASGALLRPAAQHVARTSPPRSAAASSTTRCGSCGASSPSTRSAARRWAATAGEGVVDAYGQRLRSPGPAHRRRLGDARADGSQPQLHDRCAGRPLRRPDHRTRPTRRGGGRHMTASVRFTEEMLGHVTFGESDFARGAQPDRDGSAAFKFHLTIEVEDIERFGSRPAAPGDRRGLRRVRRARRPARGAAGLVQPVRRRRAGRQAHALPAVVPRRRRAPADHDRASSSSETTPASTSGRTRRRSSHACSGGMWRKATTPRPSSSRPASSGSACATSRSSSRRSVPAARTRARSSARSARFGVIFVAAAR